MVSAVSATNTNVDSSQTGQPSAASLQARLDQYQKQLADCVNCASAKTPEGKAEIARLSATISRVEDSISKGQLRSNPGGNQAGRDTQQAGRQPSLASASAAGASATRASAALSPASVPGSIFPSTVSRAQGPDYQGLAPSGPPVAVNILASRAQLGTQVDVYA